MWCLQKFHARILLFQEQHFLLQYSVCAKIFCSQSKGDLFGAEEYYSLAVLANPEDGEVLIQYAKMIWQLHHDKERAMNYFKHAAEVSPQDRFILFYLHLEISKVSTMCMFNVSKVTYIFFFFSF